jgi:hypothetical protein
MKAGHATNKLGTHFTQQYTITMHTMCGSNHLERTVREWALALPSCVLNVTLVLLPATNRYMYQNFHEKSPQLIKKPKNYITAYNDTTAITIRDEQR